MSKAPKNQNREPDNVGCGVSRIVPIVKVPEPKAVSLDPPPVWVDKPTVENQISREGMYKLSSRSAQVFDLSKPMELERYNELLDQTAKPDTNTFIIAEERQFATDSSNWKILVMLQTVKFKQIIKDSK